MRVCGSYSFRKMWTPRQVSPVFSICARAAAAVRVLPLDVAEARLEPLEPERLDRAEDGEELVEVAWLERPGIGLAADARAGRGDAWEGQRQGDREGRAGGMLRRNSRRDISMTVASRAAPWRIPARARGQGPWRDLL